MTILTQWLIFGGVIAVLFAWGLFAKEGDGSDAKEGHIALATMKGKVGRAQPEPVMHETAHV